LIIGIVIAVVVIAVIVGVLINQRATPGTQDKYVNDRLNELFADNVSEVEISNFQFSPSTITINAGQTYSHTFNTLGTYNYHCSPHPGMKAKVIVR
jgi:plastocyanin